MQQSLSILVLAGTTRRERKSILAARLIERIGQGIDGINVQLVDPIDFNFAGDGNHPEGKDPRYSQLTADADGFFIVCPEYNHSFPGSLKRMLDSELANYVHKPVAFAGVSSGRWGGVRAVEALVGFVREMGMVATFSDVYFPKIQDLFDESGMLTDQYYHKAVEAAYKELLWMANALKAARAA